MGISPIIAALAFLAAQPPGKGGELKEKVPEAWIQKPSSASLCLLLAVCLGAGLF